MCPSPALDVTYRVARLAVGGSNRVAAVTRRAGGKAVNVARVVHDAGVPARLVAPVGGDTGEVFADDLRVAGIELLPAASTAATRVTVTVVADDGSATVLNEPASVGGAWDGTLALVIASLADSDVLVVSGSMPADVEPAAVAPLVTAARRAGRPAVVDTSGAPLLAALDAGATLVKPNRDELAAVTGERDPAVAATTLARRYGAVVVASLGADGVLAAGGDHLWAARPPERLTGNPTGAGDALVAGIAMRFDPDLPPAAWLPEALREGVALSAAAVLVPHAGSVDVAYTARVRDEIVVEAVDAPAAAP